MMMIQRFVQLAQADAAPSATPLPERRYLFPSISRFFLTNSLVFVSPIHSANSA
jgi:hypothetical protein